MQLNVYKTIEKKNKRKELNINGKIQIRKLTWNTTLADSLKMHSAGESIGGEDVNFLSNCDTSSSLLNFGLKGVSSFRDITSFQLM